MKNIKKIAKIAVATLAITGMSLIIHQNNSSASSYKVEKVTINSSISENFYHVKNKSKNVYLWNSTRTKVKANLKNYKNYSWIYNGKNAVVSHNGKKAIYYYVSSYDPSHKYVSKVGMVWHGYLDRGFNTNYKVLNDVSPFRFMNDNEYMNYIKQSPSQKVTREVLKLFPNTKISLKLTQNFEQYESLDNLGYSKVLAFPAATKYMDHIIYKKNISDKTRINLIKSALNNAGYTQAKRNSLSNYKIGIFYYANAKNQTFDDYPGIVLAK
ncbi:hypothetical protein FC56_GL000324 [Lentilactobacillus senioris DSM 24302 = JCM 17472]|uniref:D-alanyl-D-alanine carboxypeptidase n=1 Tax=Lentilactobacillus senioris DSM 24302 = JCM 17472 TaxID=1423802 RepID=A0A0R2CPY1_9LACO|nr:hypothetical protein [Lentilactobacillus senioris]KRM93607.1 hypothetical protein FC56_GL000324 [Lentilactobacillus senioris DSM 24302 = JCM 17472]